MIASLAAQQDTRRDGRSTRGGPAHGGCKPMYRGPYGIVGLIAAIILILLLLELLGVINVF